MRTAPLAPAGKGKAGHANAGRILRTKPQSSTALTHLNGAMA